MYTRKYVKKKKVLYNIVCHNKKPKTIQMSLYRKMNFKNCSILHKGIVHSKKMNEIWV